MKQYNSDLLERIQTALLIATKRKGLSQNKITRLAGTSENIFFDKGNYPQLKTLLRLAEVLDCTVEVVLVDMKKE